MIYALVFLATFIADVAWTMYFKEVAKERALFAASWSALIVLIGGFTVIQYVHAPHILIATVSGSFFGTYATMKWPAIRAWVIAQRPDPGDRV